MAALNATQYLTMKKLKTLESLLEITSAAALITPNIKAKTIIYSLL